MSRLAAIALALAVDAAAGLAGGLLSETWLRAHLEPLVGFAAGALIGVAFLDLLPDVAVRLGTLGFALALAAFAGSAVLEWRLDHHHGTASGPLPLALLASDALHNTGDGAAVAAAFLVSTHAGIATAAAVIFHEVPQEVGDYALLRAAGWSRARGLLGLFGVQLTAYLGAGVVLLAATHAERVTGIAIALAAGTFLYIGAVDLLPGLRGGRRPAFVLGLACMAVLSFTLH